VVWQTLRVGQRQVGSNHRRCHGKGAPEQSQTRAADPRHLLVIGAVVAGSHHYFDNLGSIGAILSAIIAVVLWPLILLGVKLTIAT
jgi:hypothetical protein